MCLNATAAAHASLVLACQLRAGQTLVYTCKRCTPISGIVSFRMRPHSSLPCRCDHSSVCKGPPSAAFMLGLAQQTDLEADLACFSGCRLCCCDRGNVHHPVSQCDVWKLHVSAIALNIWNAASFMHKSNLSSGNLKSEQKVQVHRLLRKGAPDVVV